MPSGYLISCHFLKTERNARNPQPIRRIRTKRQCTSGTYDGICAINSYAVDHSNDAVFF
jgi:hypothetical protein